MKFLSKFLLALYFIGVSTLSRADDNVKASNSASVSQVEEELFITSFPTAFASQSSISPKCFNDSQQYLEAFLRNEKWAMKMYAATSHDFPNVMFEDSKIFSVQFFPGLFETCLTVGQYCTAFFKEEPVSPEELMPITNSSEKGQRRTWVPIYYLLKSQVPKGPKLKEPKHRDIGKGFPALLWTPSVGFCMPSSCSSEDFRSAVAQLVGYAVVGNTTTDSGEIIYRSVVTQSGDSACFTKEKVDAAPQFDTPTIAFIVTLSVLGLIILVASLLDGHWKEGKAAEILNCFSAVSNAKKILSTRRTPSDLPCVHGIRSLSMAWVVLYHCNLGIARMQKGRWSEDAYKWEVQAIFMGPLAVDTFFLMSGMLVALSMSRELDRKGSNKVVTILLCYVHRYIRLTPIYAVVIGFIATLLIYCGSGPYWSILVTAWYADSCQINWWRNLLYFNIYMKNAKCILNSTWYLDADMQLFIVSPLFVYPLRRWLKAGVAWALFVMMGVIGALVAIFLIYDLPPTTVFQTRSSDKVQPFYSLYYFQTWPRLPEYLTGILLGWFIYEHKQKKVALRKIVVIFGWIVSIGVIVALVYGLFPYANDVQVPKIDPLPRVAYGALNRFAWTVAVGWIIFACSYGYGGVINSLLSWKVFMPLGRLTYAVYLLHETIVYLHVIGLMRKQFYYTPQSFAMLYFSILMVSFLLAFILSIAVEVPFLNLDRLLINPSSPREKKLEEPMKEKLPRVKMVKLAAESLSVA